MLHVVEDRSIQESYIMDVKVFKFHMKFIESLTFLSLSFFKLMCFLLIFLVKKFSNSEKLSDNGSPGKILSTLMDYTIVYVNYLPYDIISKDVYPNL